MNETSKKHLTALAISLRAEVIMRKAQGKKPLVGHLERLTYEDRTKLKLGIDERHERIARLCKGDLEVRRITGESCFLGKRGGQYVHVVVRGNGIEEQELTSKEATAMLKQARRYAKPYADIFSNELLYAPKYATSASKTRQ